MLIIATVLGSGGGNYILVRWMLTKLGKRVERIERFLKIYNGGAARPEPVDAEAGLRPSGGRPSA